MISIEKPDYHATRCDVCSSGHDVKLIRFVNDYTNQGTIAAAAVKVDYLERLNWIIWERWQNEMIEHDSCCGNCLWFDGEDICGYGFCDEKEAEVCCSNCCPKWKRNTEMDEVEE